ncbi:hypothetical protein, partial [Sporolactobacillus inulinus]
MLISGFRAGSAADFSHLSFASSKDAVLGPMDFIRKLGFAIDLVPDGHYSCSLAAASPGASSDR